MKPGNPVSRTRRLALKTLGLFGGLLAAGRSQAHHTATHFEDSSPHNIVYQCNKADPEYLQHILFSAGELLRRYGDDVQIVIVAFGPGLQLLGKKPEHPMPAELQQRVSSLSMYGVAFHACGNTMLRPARPRLDGRRPAAVRENGADRRGRHHADAGAGLLLYQLVTLKRVDRILITISRTPRTISKRYQQRRSSLSITASRLVCGKCVSSL